MNNYRHLRPVKRSCLVVLLLCGLACHERKTGDATSTPVTGNVTAPDTSAVSANTVAMGTPLNFLKAMDGKYPSDVKLFEQKIWVKRLQKLLGRERYQFLHENWNIESLNRMSGDQFIAEACMQHNCGATHFIIVADVIKDKLYAGICDEGKVTTYGEDSLEMPQIRSWRTAKPD